MTHSEKTVLLTPEDIAFLQKQNKIFTIVAFVFFPLFIGVTYLIFSNFLGFISWLPYVVCFAELVVVYYLVKYIHRRTNKEIENGTKQVIRGVVDKKFTESKSSQNASETTIDTTTNYFITMGGNKFEIGFNNYAKVHENQYIELHRTSLYGTVLSLEQVQQ